MTGIRGAVPPPPLGEGDRGRWDEGRCRAGLGLRQHLSLQDTSRMPYGHRAVPGRDRQDVQNPSGLGLSKCSKSRFQLMITVFLGAGFSAVGGVPLASQLFDERPEADVISRTNLIDRVLCGWNKWYRKTAGTPEQYLTYLRNATGTQWVDAVWYVALTVVLQMPRVSIGGVRPTVSHHTLNLTSGVEAHELFWTTIFRRTSDIAVLTTNYDILAERGLRLTPRPRVPRPGFHYGKGHIELKGRGYPGAFRSAIPATRGSVPLLKLHGSVSWAIGTEGLEQYHDCRPAIRGDAAITAPIEEKNIPLMHMAPVRSTCCR